MSKKFVFVSLMFLSSTAAHCMDDPHTNSMFDDPDKLILVHASNVMAENNTKIAGAQSYLQDGTSFIEPKGANIQKRITYHTCLNGMIPSEHHGLNISGTNVATPGHLNTDKDVCAYLDLLRAFEGEIYGGVPHDFIIIEGHTYGKSSTIIVPQHKTEEFWKKNPNYQGNLVSFDPEIISLRDKVDQTIKLIPGAHSFAEISDKSHREQFTQFCKKNNYSHKDHNDTPFIFFEKIINEFHRTVSFINRKCNATPLLPIDQVEPLSSVIEATLDHIQEKLGSRLSNGKKEFVKFWIEDTKSWVKLFMVDAKLRLKNSKSLFRNHLDTQQLQEIMHHRQDANFIEKTAQNLPSITSIVYDDLKCRLSAQHFLQTTKSNKLFPEYSLEQLSTLPLNSIKHLYNTLMAKGQTAHATEILLYYFMKIFESNNEKKKALLLRGGEDLFNKLLSNLTPSDSLRKRLEDWTWSTLRKDPSFRNDNTISLFNSPAGKALRQKMWQDDSTLDFLTLLKINPQTSLLFKDLENEDFGYGSGSDKSLSLPWRRFTDTVRQWLLERARKNSVYIPGCTALIPAFSQPKIMSEELKNPHCSLFNINYAEKITAKLSLYTMSLQRDVRDPNNALQALIDQGCFKSWGDLIGQLYDLRGLDQEDLTKILKQDIQTASVMNLGIKINSYLSQLQEEQERFETYKPIHEAIAEQIATAGERPIEVDSLWGGGLGWYIDTLLNQCINGYTQEIGKNKVTISPNWEQAKILYKRLCELATVDERKKLDAMMESTKAQ